MYILKTSRNIYIYIYFFSFLFLFIKFCILVSQFFLFVCIMKDKSMFFTKLPQHIKTSLFKDIPFFLSKVFTFWMVTIFSLNYCYHLCFVVIHQSNQVLLKFSNDVCIKVLAGALFHFVLMSSLITKPKLAWHHNFLIEMFTITEKPLVFTEKLKFSRSFSSSSYQWMFLIFCR